MLNLYRLEQRIEHQMKETYVPGLAIAIVQDQQVIYARGFGVTSVEDGGLPVTLIFAHFLALPLVLSMLALIGVSVVGLLVTTRTLMQFNTTDAYRGRVFAARSATNSLTLLAGMFIATLAGNQVGALPFLNAAALLYILSGLLAFVMLRHAKVNLPKTTIP